MTLIFLSPWCPFQKRDGHTQDVDYVLTTRELGRLLQSHRPRLAFPSLPETPFDPIMGESSGERVEDVFVSVQE